MNKLRSIIVANRNFLLCYGFFFLIGLVIVLEKGKNASFLSLNPLHQSLLDLFFINFTYLGDGLFAVAVIILLMVLRRWSQAWQILIAFLLSALLAQILKNVFSMPRPWEVFEHGEKYAYFIDGITRRGFSSFPSGHSTTVFTLATMLAIFEKNKKNECPLPADRCRRRVFQDLPGAAFPDGRADGFFSRGCDCHPRALDICRKVSVSCSRIGFST